MLQWLLVLVAYGYLLYRLWMYDDWKSLAEHFFVADWKQYCCFLLAVAMFPLNILFEAMKWQYLMLDIEPMNITEAQRQTYFGFIGAFLTPSRVGDYPARVTMMCNSEHWAEAVSLGFVGTLALAFLQVLVGMPSCMFLLERVGGMRYMEIICGVVLFFMLLTIVFYPSISEQLSERMSDGRWRNVLVCLSRFSHKKFLTTLLLSVLRYSVYCSQLWLVLMFCGIELDFTETLIAIPAYYLLITITPSVPVADAAVRGSWSVVVFGQFTDNIPNIAIAAVLLWVLNTILPMLVGTMMPKLNDNKKNNL